MNLQNVVFAEGKFWIQNPINGQLTPIQFGNMGGGVKRITNIISGGGAEAGNFKLKKDGLEYTLDNGATFLVPIPLSDNRFEITIPTTKMVKEIHFSAGAPADQNWNFGTLNQWNIPQLASEGDTNGVWEQPGVIINAHNTFRNPSFAFAFPSNPVTMGNYQGDGFNLKGTCIMCYAFLDEDSFFLRGWNANISAITPTSFTLQFQSMDRYNDAGPGTPPLAYDLNCNWYAVTE